jgi:hypothetical protein
MDLAKEIQYGRLVRMKDESGKRKRNSDATAAENFFSFMLKGACHERDSTNPN